jgi:hypothetical protein
MAKSNTMSYLGLSYIKTVAQSRILNVSTLYLYFSFSVSFFLTLLNLEDSSCPVLSSAMGKETHITRNSISFQSKGNKSLANSYITELPNKFSSPRQVLDDYSPHQQCNS